jgi:hypothetical protein
MLPPLLVLAVAAGAAGLGACESPPPAEPQVLLSDLSVAPANASGFATRVAYHDGVFYTANVEPGPDDAGPIGLRTVVRRGVRGNDGTWKWQSKVLDAHTLDDPWHTQPSIAVDADGHVHVAYNMHNMPWQYAVSARRSNISDFVFRGELVSHEQRMRVQTQNQTHFFDGPGTAAIPGNQITYPRFYSDPYGELYVTYRYALRPARPWHDRWLGGGVARLDRQRGIWQPVGSALARGREDVRVPRNTDHPDTHPFAYEPGWTVYMMELAFDAQGGMHVAWLWREGGPGATAALPSYAYSPDGGKTFQRSDGRPYQMPIRLKAAEKLVDDPARKFHTPLQLAADAEGRPYVYLSPAGGGKQARRLLRARSAGGWQELEPPPHSATTIAIGPGGVHWAAASGMRIFRRAGDGQWSERTRFDGYCKPWSRAVRDGLLVHAERCDNPQKIGVFWVPAADGSGGGTQPR